MDKYVIIIAGLLSGGYIVRRFIKQIKGEAKCNCSQQSKCDLSKKLNCK